MASSTVAEFDGNLEFDPATQPVCDTVPMPPFYKCRNTDVRTWAGPRLKVPSAHPYSRGCSSRLRKSADTWAFRFERAMTWNQLPPGRLARRGRSAGDRCQSRVGRCKRLARLPASRREGEDAHSRHCRARSRSARDAFAASVIDAGGSISAVISLERRDALYRPADGGTLLQTAPCRGKGQPGQAT